jgi:tetratricopeptide (TPR) repeat protein
VSLLLDALRRAGAAREEAVAEPLGRTRERGDPRVDTTAPRCDTGAGAPDDADPTREAPAEQARPASPPAPTHPGQGQARAETVSRGGARRGPDLGRLGVIAAAGCGLIAVAAGSGWYYYSAAQATVDRTLARYEPETRRSAARELETGDPGTGSPEPSNPRTSHPGSGHPDTATATALPAETAVAPHAAQADAVSETAPESGATGEQAGTAAEAAAPSAAASAQLADAGSQAPKAEDASAEASAGKATAPTQTRANAGQGTPAAAGDGSGPAQSASREAPTTDASKPPAESASQASEPAAQATDNDALVRASEGSTVALGRILQQGYSALQADKVAAAGRHYQRALERAPANRDALLGAAAVARRQNEAGRAAEYYRQVLAARPRDPYARAGLAELGRGGGRRHSESELKSLLADAPDAPALRFALGNLYAREARWADAQAAYFQASQGAPSNPDYTFNLAVALDHLDQGASARRYYAKALALADGQAVGFSPAAARRRLEQLSP